MTPTLALEALVADYARQVLDYGSDCDTIRAALAVAVMEKFAKDKHPNENVPYALFLFDGKVGRTRRPASAKAKATIAPRRRDTSDVKALAASLASLGIVRASEVEPESVAWLWPGRIPRGKITVLDGRPGCGKTTLLCDVAARVTAMRAWPDEDIVHPGRVPETVLYVSTEDGAADTLRPRLDAAGADATRVHIWQGSEAGDILRLPDGIKDLERVIRETGARLVVIDTLFNHLGSGLNANSDADVRQALAPLAALAERTGIAIVCVRHFNKGARGDALLAGGGSIGIAGIARVVLAAGQVPGAAPDDPARVLAVSKNNLAAFPKSLSYVIETVDLVTDGGVPVTTSVVRWRGPVDVTADDLAAPKDIPSTGQERTARAEARDWLADALAHGPRLAVDVDAEAKAEGHSVSTLKRAKKDLGVKSVRQGFGSEGEFLWALPTDAEAPDSHPSPSVAIDAHPAAFPLDVATYGPGGHQWENGLQLPPSRIPSMATPNSPFIDGHPEKQNVDGAGWGTPGDGAPGSAPTPAMEAPDGDEDDNDIYAED